jgi:hypothetical protein
MHDFALRYRLLFCNTKSIKKVHSGKGEVIFMFRHLVPAVFLASLFVAVAPAQSRTAVIVELFTSEGCSSCPPADNVLTRLQRTLPDIEVIPLSEHVDYWNHLGWRDPYSASLYSARQQDYGRAFRIESVYTPQMVVNGQAQFNGSDQTRALQEIRKAADGPHASAQLTKLSEETVRLRVDNLPEGTRNADMFLAITESFIESDVHAGENNGRRWQQTGVVRSLTTLGHIDTKKAVSYMADAKININPDWKRSNVRLVLFVQDRATRRVIGAATLQP